MEEHDAWFREELVRRFVRYARIETTSDRNGGSTPSTRGQWDLIRLLEAELTELGVPSVSVDERGYVIARIPGTVAAGTDCPSIGLMAHVDTAADVSAKDVNPVVRDAYDGAPIALGEGLVLDPEEYPLLRRYRGETIITTDGRTLLGADDKAGVAEIMTAVAYLMRHPDHPHGPLEIIFTPDEETGHGMDHFPVDQLQSVACYTLDGGEEGVVEAECFTAYRVDVVLTGSVIHLGTARGKLRNAVTMAGRFIDLLPQNESPEATDEAYGYYCPVAVQGDLERASIEILLRDFERAEIDRRIGALESIGKAVEALFPGSSVSLSATKQYTNMRDAFSRHPEVVENLAKAVRAAGVEPEMRRIRGGTDGARLSETGVPTPNVFTGGQNYHSRLEWIAVPAMVRACHTILHLVRHWT
jgi:tripeptide aminopeptidase